MPSTRYIGSAAREAGLSVKAVRHYEALGLLAPPERTEAGYRTYSDVEVERLRFIHGARNLGLGLEDIKAIVSAWAAGEAPCRHVEARLTEKITELDRRIAELTRFRDGLSGYLREQEGRSGAGVPCRHVEGALAETFALAVPGAGRSGPSC